MKKIVTVLLVLIASLNLFAERIINVGNAKIRLEDNNTYGFVYSGDVMKAPNGRMIVLKDNYTWEYIPEYRNEIIKDESGRRIWLKANRKWGYMRDFREMAEFKFKGVSLHDMKDGRTRIKGRVVNTSGRNYKMVEFGIDVFDSGEYEYKMLGTFKMERFKANEEKEFEVYYNIQKENISEYNINLLNSEEMKIKRKRVAKEQSEFKIRNVQLYDTGKGMTKLKGKLINQTSKNYKYVEFEVEIFDDYEYDYFKSGNLVIEDVKANGEKEFEYTVKIRKEDLAEYFFDFQRAEEAKVKKSRLTKNNDDFKFKGVSFHNMKNGKTRVKGKVTNLSGKNYKNVEFEVEVFDEELYDYRKLGTVVIENFKADEDRDFEEYYNIRKENITEWYIDFVKGEEMKTIKRLPEKKKKKTLREIQDNLDGQ